MQLLLSALLCVIAAFSLNTFVRLHDAKKTYSSDDAFEDATHISTVYLKGGIALCSIVLILGLVLTVISSIKVYKVK